MFGKYLLKVKEKKPLIHCITNYVTVNDVANMILACGANPLMADAPEEASEITSISDGLNINIGTLNSMTVRSMLISGKKANELGIPAVLDPVGAGSGRYRTETALELMKNIHFSVIKGNLSEIMTLSSLFAGSGSGRGIPDFRPKGADSGIEEQINDNNVMKYAAYARELAAAADCIIVITGASDLVCDSGNCYIIKNGRPEMGKITGTGCQLSGLLTAFAASSPEDLLNACAAAVCAMGASGEIAREHMLEHEGNSTYRSRMIDAVYNMDPQTLDDREKSILCQ